MNNMNNEKIFVRYSKYQDPYAYINNVSNIYFNDLNKCNNNIDYNEMINLVEEWIIDYVGNMDLTDTNYLLNNLGYCISLFNIDKCLYKPIVLNKILIVNIIFKEISKKMINNNKIFDEKLNIFIQ